MNSPPEVSILLPFYNAADTLDECLDSIERQTLESYELLAVDDGSDDASSERVRRRAADDPRIRLLSPGRLGLVGALNLGIEAARASLLARMDADDLMHPRRLELQAEFLRRHPDIALVGSQVELFPPELIREGYREYIRWQNACIEPEEIAAQIYVESPLAHPSVMARTAVLEHLSGYRDGPFPEDYELWLRMHHAGCRMAKVPQVLLQWRESGDRTSRVDPRYSREAFDRLRAAYLAREECLRGARGFVVCGAGRKTRHRVRPLIEQGLTPIAWIDVDPKKIGSEFEGRPVRPLEWLRDTDPRPFVLIYIARHGAREAVEACLEGWGCRRSEDYLSVG